MRYIVLTLALLVTSPALAGQVFKLKPGDVVTNMETGQEEVWDGTKMQPKPFDPKAYVAKDLEKKPFDPDAYIKANNIQVPGEKLSAEEVKNGQFLDEPEPTPTWWAQHGWGAVGFVLGGLVGLAILLVGCYWILRYAAHAITRGIDTARNPKVSKPD